MTSEEAMKVFKREYYKACASETCNHPVSAALFEAWLISVYGYKYDVSTFSDDEVDMIITGRSKST